MYHLCSKSLTERNTWTRQASCWARKTPWYLRRDVLDIKHGHAERAAPIVISGIFRDWTEHARSLGYQIDTNNRTIEVVRLPEVTCVTFDIERGRQFVRRSRISFVNHIPICIWASYYPLDLVQGPIHEAMKQDKDLDVVKRIKEEHNVKIGWVKERDNSRLTNLEEQRLLQLRNAAPVLIKQRVSTTSDRNTLVLYSHMTLLGSWFAPVHEYSVNIWDESE